MAELFSDDEGPSTGNHMLTINEHYAKAFEYRKEREELEKLKAKYGSDYDPDEDESTDSESAESEDEHGEELTPAVDAAILRTLARIRKKDPEIYDSQKDIFGQERKKVETKVPRVLDGQAKPKTKSKPVTIKQVNLEAMLNPSRSPSPEPLTHVQEQEALRKETIAAFHNAVPEGEEDDFLIPREKTQDERDREEEEYRAFLEREVGDLRDLVSVAGSDDDEEKVNEEIEADTEQEKGGKDKKKKKKKSKTTEGEIEKPKKSKAEEDQEFLMNYILNRGWIDRSEGHVPTYKEVTSEAKERSRKKGKSKVEPQDDAGSEDNEEQNENEDDNGILSDASFESVASFFEASYNHRFEEPGAATIPSFPRNLPATIRREDTTRKDARERKKQRKEEELQKKHEEVKRMKALKMREVKRKLELIGKQGGLKHAGGDGEDDTFVDEALRELDLEGEWDPEKHDRQMAGLFDRGAEAFEDEEPYEGEEDQGFGDDDVKFDADGKPIWDDDIDIGDISMSDDGDDVIYGSSPAKSKKDKKKKKKKKKKDEEDDGGVDIDAMDADIKPMYDEDEEWDGTEEMRKRKFNEYMDEIYGLEFNDLIGDMPTRFKYTKVQPQNFALTPAEILMATDQELNEYMSVKKYAPYRQERGHYNKSTQENLHDLKAKLGERVGSSFGNAAARRRAPGAEHQDGDKVKKRKGKKERMKMKALNGGGDEVDDTVPQDIQPVPTKATGFDEGSKKDKKRKREQDQDPSPTQVVNPGEDGEAAAKKKRKRNRKKHGESEITVES